MTQSGLFDEPPDDICRTHHGGNEDSEAANASIDEHKHAIRERIFGYLKESQGAICDEAEEALGLRHQTCSARITELLAAKRVHRTQEKRKTRSGRMAAVIRVGAPIDA